MVNDIAERVVRLMEEYKDVLTDDEEHRKMILHCVEETRKLYPSISIRRDQVMRVLEIKTTSSRMLEHELSLQFFSEISKIWCINVHIRNHKSKNTLCLIVGVWQTYCS